MDPWEPAEHLLKSLFHLYSPGPIDELAPVRMNTRSRSLSLLQGSGVQPGGGEGWYPGPPHPLSDVVCTSNIPSPQLWVLTFKMGKELL